ncbi:hypothetical protein OG426_56170 (plasmid) [Streptomyces canus]|uniref:hypothetical protein n=1 Tax=Streptomyces canus TaxID=58343 RepID=UPI002F906AE2|nr:hypothetical protein OG426_56170 [Streptomyces canus]
MSAASELPRLPKDHFIRKHDFMQVDRTKRLVGRGDSVLLTVGDDLCLMSRDQLSRVRDLPAATESARVLGRMILFRNPTLTPPQDLVSSCLVIPRSERWDEATATALHGAWSDALWETGRLPSAALGLLRAEARTIHRQLVPLWRRRTRHGRVLSLDSDLGDGLSLHDLVAADTDLLTRTGEWVFDDERLNAVLRKLTSDELRVVLAYAEGEGPTWTEAAAAAGATDPAALGERVRRKVKRLATEQARRTRLRHAVTSSPVQPSSGTGKGHRPFGTGSTPA